MSDRLKYLEASSVGLFNFEGAFDVKIFDDLTSALYHSTGPENIFAKNVLEKFLEDERSWCRVDMILENASSDESRFYALLILERLVRGKWKLLPSEQRISIRDYVVQQIIQVGCQGDSIETRKVYLNKLVCLLIEILKFEWPDRWPEFINEIIMSSTLSESLCLVNMKILRLLAEEIFLYSSTQMTHIKIEFLKTELKSQFSALFHHIYKILLESTNIPLILETLKTFTCFIPYIEHGFIFETSVIDTLLERLISEPVFTNETLLCTSEIMALDSKDYTSHKLALYSRVLNKIKNIIPSNFDFNLAYNNGTEMQQRFMRILAIFFLQSLKEYSRIFTPTVHMDLLLDGFYYVLATTSINEVEIFKICMELWKSFTFTVRLDKTRADSRNDVSIQKIVDGFQPILSKLRYLMVANMKRPEEVTIYVNEHGEVVRQHMRDTDSINLYYICKEVLMDLTVLNPEEMRTIIYDKLEMLMSSQEFVWADLNCVGWAVGSMSGAMNADMERDFVVHVLKNLLNLCDEKQGKDNKAIIASNIMYVCQQYPRFLRPYYRFLKTVMNKLLEFMMEKHEGVQDMACDAFLKICKSCRFQLANLQNEDAVPYLESVNGLAKYLSLLNIQQLETVFEALGNIVSSYESDRNAQKVTWKCFDNYVTSYEEYVSEINRNFNLFIDSDKQQLIVIRFLRISRSFCKDASNHFELIYSRVFNSFIALYNLSCNYILQKVSSFGPNASVYSDVKTVRTFKREFLNLTTCMIKMTQDGADNIKSKYFTSLSDIILPDYSNSLPSLREYEILTLYSVLVDFLSVRISDSIFILFQQLVNPTISMIDKDMQEWPDHRIHLFRFIDSCITNCFVSLTNFQPAQLDYLIQALYYAISHTMPDVAQIGISALNLLFKTTSQDEYSSSQFATLLYKKYLISTLERILSLCTDGLHSSEIADHAFIVSQLISTVSLNKMSFPFYEPHEPYTQNLQYLKSRLTDSIRNMYPHLNSDQSSLFIDGLFCFCNDREKTIQHIRDFSILVKEHAGNEFDEKFATALRSEMVKAAKTNPPPQITTKQRERPLYDYHTVS